jgi:hypothetical protein
MSKFFSSWAQVIPSQESFKPQRWENGHGTGGNFCLYCCKPVHDKDSYFNLKKKEDQNSHASNFNSNADRQNYLSQVVVFTATLKNKILTDDI